MAWSRFSGTSVPTTAAACSSRRASTGSRSIRAASTACTVAGTWMLCTSRAEAVRAPVAGEGLALDQRAHAFLEEERVAPRARDEDTLERLEPGVVTEQRVEQLVRARGRQRVDAELGVVGLAPPPCWYSGR